MSILAVPFWAALGLFCRLFGRRIFSAAQWERAMADARHDGMVAKLGNVLEVVREHERALAKDAHPLAPGFVRVVRGIGDELEQLPAVQPAAKEVPRREMSPVFTMLPMDGTEWRDTVLKSLSGASKVRLLPTGFLAEVGDVHIDCVHGRMCRLENVSTGMYATVDGRGSPHIFSAELAFELRLLLLPPAPARDPETGETIGRPA